MGALYVYAIADQPDLDLPSARGIGDAAISGLRAGDLLAVVSSIEGDSVPLSRNNLLCHERVIEALMSVRTVLPARFGTTTERAERILHTLETNGDSYHANLDRVRGRVEIAMRVGWEPEADSPVARPRAADVADGRSYMQALLERTQGSQRRRTMAENLAASLTAGLAELADATVEKVMPTPQLLLKAAYLVRREHVPEIRRRIEALRAANPTLAILATGPWPAYSFVEEGNVT
jgi:hypothetical protein